MAACHPDRPSKGHGLCGACYRRAYAQQNPDRILSIDLKSKYGITLEQYNEMLNSQGGVCAVCHNPPSESKRLAVDHNHKTGEVRALLCSKCNCALGQLNEDPELIQALLVYIKAHQCL